MMLCFYLIAIACIMLFVALCIESANLKKCQQSIPVRIGITGTRGKSSVVRMIAAVLREHGIKTLGKTTGSRACLILPDGTDETIVRLGKPSIIEQKALIRKAAGLKCGAVVCEIMSVEKEYQDMESTRLLDITHCVITNTRIDHPEQGATKTMVADVLGTSCNRHSQVFCLKDEMPLYLAKAEAAECELIGVEPRSCTIKLPYVEFDQNTALAYAVTRSLGCEPDTIKRALESVAPDIGALHIWKVDNYYCVNAFASNDVESTVAVMNKLPETTMRMLVLNTRRDRQFRTRQLCRAIIAGQLGECRMVVCVGDNVGYAMGMLKKASYPRASLRHATPRGLHALIDEYGYRDCQDIQIVGIGNIQSFGHELIAYWDRKGIRCEY